jgi:hypothetical protein
LLPREYTSRDVASTKLPDRISSFATAFPERKTTLQNTRHCARLKKHTTNLHQYGAKATIVGAKQAVCSTTTLSVCPVCSPDTTITRCTMRKKRKKPTFA